MHDFDCILLTGGSGAIGAYILRELAGDQTVPIFCILRGKASLERLIAAVGPEVADRIIPIYADLSVRGQVEATLNQIGRFPRCLAIHCAAEVSWTKSERLSGPINVEGTRNFAWLAVSVSREQPVLVFLSTAFCEQGYPPRNAYEATKLAAELLLEQEFGDLAQIAILKCSLVVGAEVDGWIARFNGVYPLIRILALAEVPCLIADAQYQIDCVPVSFVWNQITSAVGELRAGARLVRLVTAAGSLSLPIQELVRHTVERVDRARQACGLESLPIISIISERQFRFLMSASKSWSLTRRFSKVEEISEVMSGYIAHGGSSRNIKSSTLGGPAPDPKTYIARVLDFWIERQAARVLSSRQPEWLTADEAVAV